MAIVIILILVGILGLVFAVVSYPLFKEADEINDSLEMKINLKRAEYGLVLSRIRELEQERADDKISSDDYQSLRDQLNLEAASCLRAIEAVEAE